MTTYNLKKHTIGTTISSVNISPEMKAVLDGHQRLQQSTYDALTARIFDEWSGLVDRRKVRDFFGWKRDPQQPLRSILRSLSDQADHLGAGEDPMVYGYGEFEDGCGYEGETLHARVYALAGRLAILLSELEQLP